MKNLYLKGAVVVCSLILMVTGKTYGQANTVTTFSHTGAFQTFTVPPCVTQLTMQVWGAEGGGSSLSGNSSSGLGGKGGYATGVMTVVPGSVMYIYVGGHGLSSTSGVAAGGFNGGGSGHASSSAEPGNGGGGASDIRINGQNLSNRIIIAGGGGGGGEDGGDPYGHGGGLTGVGYNTTYDASQTAAGAGGALGQGSSTNYGDGGGGGGGYYGGGGQSSASIGTDCQGGGGGSGFVGVGVLTSTALIAGNATMPDPNGSTMVGRSGHGLVRLTYNMNGAGVTIAASPSTLCTGSSVTLTAGSVSTYTWLPVGSFTGANTTTITDSPIATTMYTVQGTNTQGCITSAIYTLTVDQGLPVLSVVNTSSSTGGICPTKTVALTASGARTYTWVASAGTATNGVPFAPSTSATYTVTGSNACGTATAATSVSVHPLPTITTVVSTPSICSGQTVSFNAVGNATSYVWTPNYTSGTPLFLQTNTTYSVLGTSALGCTLMATAFVSVVTTPMSQPLSNPPLICIGSSATLTAPGAASYTWTTPTGTLGTTQIIVSPAVTTTYTVAKSNANCVDVQTVQVIVNGLPTVQVVAAPPVVCAGKPSVLSGGGAGSFTWTAPGFTTTGSNPTVTPINSTTYMVAGSDGTCIGTASVQVLTNPNPVIGIVPTSSTICRGDSVTLNANGALTYTWTTSSGTLSAYPTGTAISQSVEDKPTLTTLYTITGVNQHTCFTTVTQVVVVNPTPTLNVQTTKPLVCTNSVSTLTVTGANTYTWDIVNAGGVTTSVNAVTPISTTIYSVTGFYSNTGCNSTKTIQVTVFEPNFTVNSPTSSCQGGTINLIASGANSYIWQTNPPQPFSQISVSPSTPTFYVVSAISNSNGVNCPSTKTVNVTIYANPTITAATSKTLVCKGEPAYLAGGGGVSYQWTPAGGPGDTVMVKPNGHTTYYVVGTDQNGCTGTASVQVKVQTCFGIEELTADKLGLKIYPNPNNGQFTLSTETDLSLDVINGVGQLIRSINVRANETQKINLGALPAGVYFLTGNHQGERFTQRLIVQ